MSVRCKRRWWWVGASAQVIIWPCCNLLSHPHAHVDFVLLHAGPAMLFSGPFQKSPSNPALSVTHWTLWAHSSCCSLLQTWSSRTLWGDFLTICLNALGSHSYSTDIHLIQERAHSSPLPHPPPLILVGYELRAQALFIKKVLPGWHELCQIVSAEEVNRRHRPAKNCRLPLQA